MFDFGMFLKGFFTLITAGFIWVLNDQRDKQKSLKAKIEKLEDDIGELEVKIATIEGANDQIRKLIDDYFENLDKRFNSFESQFDKKFDRFDRQFEVVADDIKHLISKTK